MRAAAAARRPLRPPPPRRPRPRRRRAAAARARRGRGPCACGLWRLAAADGAARPCQRMVATARRRWPAGGAREGEARARGRGFARWRVARRVRWRGRVRRRRQYGVWRRCERRRGGGRGRLALALVVREAGREARKLVRDRLGDLIAERADEGAHHLGQRAAHVGELVLDLLAELALRLERAVELGFEPLDERGLLGERRLVVLHAAAERRVLGAAAVVGRGAKAGRCEEERLARRAAAARVRACRGEAALVRALRLRALRRSTAEAERVPRRAADVGRRAEEALRGGEGHGRWERWVVARRHEMDGWRVGGRLAAHAAASHARAASITSIRVLLFRKTHRSPPRGAYILTPLFSLLSHALRCTQPPQRVVSALSQAHLLSRSLFAQPHLTQRRALSSSSRQHTGYPRVRPQARISTRHTLKQDTHTHST